MAAQIPPKEVQDHEDRRQIGEDGASWRTGQDDESALV